MATKQAKAKENRERNPSPINGQVLPDGFEKHPERRHNGAWKKEDTLRYKLQQIAKMTAEQLKGLLSNPEVGEYEKITAQTILQLSLMDAEKRWRVIEGLTNQDSGMPKQQIDQTNIELVPILPKLKKKKEQRKNNDEQSDERLRM